MHSIVDYLFCNFIRILSLGSPGKVGVVLEVVTVDVTYPNTLGPEGIRITEMFG